MCEQVDNSQRALPRDPQSYQPCPSLCGCVFTQLSPIAMVTGYKYPWQLTDKGVVDKEQAVQCDTDHEH